MGTDWEQIMLGLVVRGGDFALTVSELEGSQGEF